MQPSEMNEKELFLEYIHTASQAAQAKYAMYMADSKFCTSSIDSNVDRMTYLEESKKHYEEYIKLRNRLDWLQDFLRVQNGVDIAFLMDNPF